MIKWSSLDELLQLSYPSILHIHKFHKLNAIRQKKRKRNETLSIVVSINRFKGLIVFVVFTKQIVQKRIISSIFLNASFVCERLPFVGCVNSEFVSLLRCVRSLSPFGCTDYSRRRRLSVRHCSCAHKHLNAPALCVWVSGTLRPHACDIRVRVRGRCSSERAARNECVMRTSFNHIAVRQRARTLGVAFVWQTYICLICVRVQTLTHGHTEYDGHGWNRL